MGLTARYERKGSRLRRHPAEERAMREPTIKTEMFGRDRYVTVVFELNEQTAEYVSAWFIDPENPEEAPEAERERLIARARDLLRQTAGLQLRDRT